MQKEYTLLWLFIVPFLFQSFSQERIELTDQKIKIRAGGTEELYFGFEAGDQISFSFLVLNGKPLKEIEITALPNNTKFADFKTSSTTKTISVSERNVYRFKFKNGSLTPRICNVHIERIPLNEKTVNFNTNVVWKTIYDTTFIPYKEDSLVGYDTLIYPETVKELDTTIYVEQIFMDRSEKVHSYYNSNSSYTYIAVNLPANKIESYRKEKTISWAYWIGVGDESRQAYAKNVKALGQLASGVATFYTTPLGGLAVGAIAELITPSRGEDVYYIFMPTFEDAQNFINRNSCMQWNKGKGIASYAKYTNRLNNRFFIGLHNDNNTVGIDVNIKVSVIREIKTYKDVTYDRELITPKFVELDKVKTKIKSNKVRICADQ